MWIAESLGCFGSATAGAFYVSGDVVRIYIHTSCSQKQTVPISFVNCLLLTSVFHKLLQQIISVLNLILCL
uniref:Uncharacterized protein n=1 Tax=Aegilops tauschii subsp. strangulata TaxID=200361 RepID=A0A453H996_AEGTS